MRAMDRDHEGMNIQDSYLGRARKERAWLTVFLNSGKKIVGRIKSFDRYTVILEERGGEQMIFKHAIATINVSRSFANHIDFDRSGKPREAARTHEAEGARPREGTPGPPDEAPKPLTEAPEPRDAAAAPARPDGAD